MIYTVTFNPALDYIMEVPDFSLGVTNRTIKDCIDFGGKGINVSAILTELGCDNVSLGFIAGFTGEELVKRLKIRGIKTDFIRLKDGFTRINIKLKSKTESEINAKGPDISKSELEHFLKKLELLNKGDTLVLSGSIPSSIPKDIYKIIIKKLSGRGIRFVVDACKELLLDTLEYKPFLIKPNLWELEEIFDKKFTDRSEMFKAAHTLKNNGAVNVIVSLGADGAILVDEFGIEHYCPSYVGKAINTVGSGDSMIAGFLAGIDKGYDFALELANACGGATAFSLSLARKEEIYELINTKK